jgi:hypothetical protein
MTEISLLLVCAVAFLAVTLILGVLAGVIRLLTALFPERPSDESDDEPWIAAVHAAVALAHPGARITNVEETR